MGKPRSITVNFRTLDGVKKLSEIMQQPLTSRRIKFDGGVRLPSLLEKINSEHRQACDSAHKALGHAAECGRLLIEAKEIVGFGGWLDWLSANTEIGPRQCQKRTTALFGSCAETSKRLRTP